MSSVVFIEHSCNCGSLLLVMLVPALQNSNFFDINKELTQVLLSKLISSFSAYGTYNVRTAPAVLPATGRLARYTGRKSFFLGFFVHMVQSAVFTFICIRIIVNILVITSAKCHLTE